MEEIGDRLPVVAGVYADGSLEAARIARMAEAEGASALLVFPPQSMSMGGQLRPEMALAHFSTIAAATDLPLICFNYTLAGGLGYPHETLLRLADAVPTIRAIKDWSGDPALHERNIRALQSLPAPGDGADDAQRLAAVSSLVLRLRRPLVGRRQRHRRLAGGAVRGGARQRPRPPPGRSTTASTRWPRRSMRRRSSTCTTA